MNFRTFLISSSNLIARGRHWHVFVVVTSVDMALEFDLFWETSIYSTPGQTVLGI